MRTLVVGLPLPHVSFDNHSFFSAPSFSEYERVLVDMSSVPLVVEEVVKQTGVHTTFGGQAVVNGEASAYAFGLVELLEMRAREAALLLDRGGTIALFGHPVVTGRGIVGMEDVWGSYSWLPAGEAFSFETDVLPGFGTGGAVLTDAGSPFAPYVRELASLVSHRVYLAEPGRDGSDVSVFARSPGGVATGFDVRVGEGHIIVLPALARPQAEREAVARALAECMGGGGSEVADGSRYEIEADEGG
jgi:hypothetical protein